MRVKHSKVSGVANPSSGSAVGGGDWDADHAITGLRPLGFLSCSDTDGTFAVAKAVGVPAGCIMRTSNGRYDLYIDDAGLVADNVQFIVSVEVNEAASIQSMTHRTALEVTGGPLGGGQFTLWVYRDASGSGVMSAATYCKFKILIFGTD